MTTGTMQSAFLMPLTCNFANIPFEFACTEVLQHHTENLISVYGPPHGTTHATHTENGISWFGLGISIQEWSGEKRVTSCSVSKQELQAERSTKTYSLAIFCVFSSSLFHPSAIQFTSLFLPICLHSLYWLCPHTASNMCLQHVTTGPVVALIL